MFHAKNYRWKIRARAESLIETLVAITVIVIATTSAMILIRTSLVGNQVIGEKVVALNLALEGIEAVKNIRDTNYLKFSSNPDDCWNALGYEISDPGDCSSYEIQDVDDATYTIIKNFSPTYTFQTWRMEEVSDEDTDGWLSLYTFESDAGALNGEEIDIYLTNQLADLASGIFTEQEADVFQRILSFEYDATNESFDVTVTVNWMVGDQEKSLTLTRNVGNVY